MQSAPARAAPIVLFILAFILVVLHCIPMGVEVPEAIGTDISGTSDATVTYAVIPRHHNDATLSCYMNDVYT